MIAEFAPAVRLHLPITDRAVFRGLVETREVLSHAFAVRDDVSYTADIGNDRTRALFYMARVGKQAVEEAMRIEIDDEGRIVT